MNPGDLEVLGDAYSDFASALVDWRASHPISDPTSGAQFDQLVADVIGNSDALGEAALTAALQSVQTSVADLKAATQKAQHALTVIKDVTMALSIGEAVVGLAACLLAPTVTTGSVVSQLGSVAQAVQKAITPASSPSGSTSG